MKTKFIIDVHSALDVITNSSSELFMVSDSTVDTVIEMLEFMVDQWNVMARKGVFGEWWVKNERVSLAGKDTDPEPIKTFENIFGSIHVYTEDMFKEDQKAHSGYEWGYENRENLGKIIIESCGDNSIPFEIMNWIESAFSAKRWHLG
jgi:hypothetical protein